MVDWKSILTEHGSAVWRTVYRLLDHDADALDCYQETFFDAWLFAQRQPVADWASFLISLATRRALDRLRQRYRSRCHLIALDDVPEPSSDVGSPVRHAQATELLERVRKEMSELPDKQAEVFWLSCVEGWSHRQIRERMQIDPGEVRVLLHRARTRLREILEFDRSAEGESNERKPTT